MNRKAAFILASLVDDLLQQIRKDLDDGDRLSGRETDAVHRRRRVERRLAESGRSIARSDAGGGRFLFGVGRVVAGRRN